MGSLYGLCFKPQKVSLQRSIKWISESAETRPDQTRPNTMPFRQELFNLLHFALSFYHERVQFASALRIDCANNAICNLLRLVLALCISATMPITNNIKFLLILPTDWLTLYSINSTRVELVYELLVEKLRGDLPGAGQFPITRKELFRSHWRLNR